MAETRIRLTDRQRLLLRLIVANGIWCPGDKWKGERIPDGSGDEVPNIGGAGDASSLRSLEAKGLITRPDSWSWSLIRPTAEGRALLEAEERKQ